MVVLTFVGIGQGSIVKCGGIIATLQPNGLIVVCYSAIVIAFVSVNDPTVVVVISGVRIEADCLLLILEGAVILAI